MKRSANWKPVLELIGDPAPLRDTLPFAAIWKPVTFHSNHFSLVFKVAGAEVEGVATVLTS